MSTNGIITRSTGEGTFQGAERKIVSKQVTTKQIKIKKGEQAELNIYQSAQKCDGKPTGVHAVLTMVGPLKIAIAIRKRAARPTR
jgi:hypothetical protein